MKKYLLVLSALLVLLGVRHIMLYLSYDTLLVEKKMQEDNYELALESQRQDFQRKLDELEALIIFRSGKVNTPLNNHPLDTQNKVTSTTAAANNQTGEIAAIQEENINRAIDKKYSLLLSSLSLSSYAQDQLRQLLIERERILGANFADYFSTDAELQDNIRKQQTMLADIDRRIAALLKPEEVGKYELLKDSAFEQYQMEGFYDALGDDNKVSQDKRNALLLNKLEQKKAFADMLEGESQAIANATPEEKNYLIEQLRQSMHDYKDNYLRDARASLSEDQFNQLREYEQNQFDQMWNSLKAGWQVN